MECCSCWFHSRIIINHNDGNGESDCHAAPRTSAAASAPRVDRLSHRFKVINRQFGLSPQSNESAEEKEANAAEMADLLPLTSSAVNQCQSHNHFIVDREDSESAERKQSGSKYSASA